MVSIIENWVVIVGLVLGIAHDPRLPEFSIITVKVEELRSVKNYPVLVGTPIGESLEITVRRDQLGTLICADQPRIVTVVRRANPTTVFAHPDWTGLMPEVVPDVP